MKFLEIVSRTSDFCYDSRKERTPEIGEERVAGK
jgi:hypothetical protein